MTANPELEIPAEGFVHEPQPQRVVFGWSRFADLESELDRLEAQRVLLISERSTEAIAQRATVSLGPRVVASIPRVRPHVPLDDAENARELARSRDADVVVTIGGGSATGFGKAVALEGLLLVAVPTTYAGSEMTPVYGITTRRRKQTARDPRALPRTVVYDPELTVSLPPRATATTGLNAVAHCVEALYAPSPTPMSQLLGQEAIRVLAASLPRVVDDPADRWGRTAALYGAYLAGTVLAAAGMAIHHRLCHVLGGTFGLSHGDVNAIVLPHVVAFNGPYAERAIARVAMSLGVSSAASGLWDLARVLGAPTSLRELDFKEADIERVAELVAESDYYNPRPVSRSDVRSIVEAAFEGERPRREALSR